MSYIDVPRMSEKTWNRVFPIINHIVIRKNGKNVLGDKLGFGQKTVDFYWDICLAFWHQILWKSLNNPYRDAVETALTQMNSEYPIDWKNSKWRDLLK